MIKRSKRDVLVFGILNVRLIMLKEVAEHMGKAEQMMKIESGNGIQSLLNEAYKLLSNPITVFNTDYRLIAHTDAPTDDPLWNELISTGTFSAETQMFFMKECFTDVVANAEKLAVMTSDKLKYARVLRHILNGKGIKVANILMLECCEAFEPDTIAAFEILADLLANEIRDDEYYIAYGEAYQDRWIRRLIDWDIEIKGLYSPHVQILYNGFKSNLYLAVVDTEQSGGAHNGQRYFVDVFRQIRKDVKYAVYDKYVVMIISTDYKVFQVERELNALADCFEQENLFAGVSSRFDNLFELRKYFAEAVEALNGMKRDKGRHVTKATPHRRKGC